MIKKLQKKYAPSSRTSISGVTSFSGVVSAQSAGSISAVFHARTRKLSAPHGSILTRSAS